MKVKKMGKLKDYYYDEYDCYNYEYDTSNMMDGDWQSYLSEMSQIPIDKTIDYKYNEGKLIDEFKEYVNSTYGQHYSRNRLQATEFIIDGGHGEGFCLGNVMKYAQRYGKKDGYNRKDIMKTLHYALIALYVHDLKHGETK
jgi:hypothetical protein